MQQCLYAVNGNEGPPTPYPYYQGTTYPPYGGKPDENDYGQEHVCPRYEDWPHGRDIIDMCTYGKPEPKGMYLSPV